MQRETISLRAFLPDDREQILDILTSELVAKTYMLPEFACRADAAPLFERLSALSKDDSRYVRCIALGGLAIGYLNDVEIKNGKIELGYVIHPNFHNKGYMTAALKLAIQELLSSDYASVVGGAFEHNAASLRVMEKAGMQRIDDTDTVDYRGVTYRCIYYAATKEKTMPKYRCLVLDHDDTVVQSMKTLSYPFFIYVLSIFRPGKTMSFSDYVRDCHHYGFADLCRLRFGFTDEELAKEHEMWMGYVLSHTPDAYPGIERIIRRQKEEGGLICVVSHSSQENILRDYDAHFGVRPDAIYGWERPEYERKPNPFPLQDIMRRYDLKPEDILVVDDMKLACKMAAPFGIKVAYAGWSGMGVPEIDEEMNELCDLSFESIAEFEEFLFG